MTRCANAAVRIVDFTPASEAIADSDGQGMGAILVG
jgi:hypothetical protein